MKKLLFSHPILLVAVGVLLIYMLLVFFSLRSNGKQEDATPSLATPTQTPRESVTVGQGPLTQEEASFPEATPQPFRHQEENATGTLIVTSDPDGATVILDAESHPGPEDPISPDGIWPQNKTPFIVEKMPIGEHVLRAFKLPDYDMDLETFSIKENEVTRVHIELIPLQTSN